jgi:hypothetical protein
MLQFWSGVGLGIVGATVIVLVRARRLTFRRR